MLKRSVFALVLGTTLVIGSAARGSDASVAGIITSVEPNRLEVTTDSQQVVSVTLTAETAYLKWITAKPWQQDIRTDARAVRPGRRVYVELTTNARPTARTVWIVTGRLGL